MKKLLLILCFAIYANAYDNTDRERNHILERIATSLEIIAKNMKNCQTQTVEYKREDFSHYPRSAGKNMPSLKAEPTNYDIVEEFSRFEKCTDDCMLLDEDDSQNRCLQNCINLYK